MSKASVAFPEATERFSQCWLALKTLYLAMILLLKIRCHMQLAMDKLHKSWPNGEHKRQSWDENKEQAHWFQDPTSSLKKPIEDLR